MYNITNSYISYVVCVASITPKAHERRPDSVRAIYTHIYIYTLYIYIYIYREREISYREREREREREIQ